MLLQTILRFINPRGTHHVEEVTKCCYDLDCLAFSLMNCMPYFLRNLNKADTDLLMLTSSPKGMCTPFEPWLVLETLLCQSPQLPELPCSTSCYIQTKFLGLRVLPCTRLEAAACSLEAFYSRGCTLQCFQRFDSCKPESADNQEICNVFVGFLCFPVLQHKEGWSWMITASTKQLKPQYLTGNSAFLSKSVKSKLERLWKTYLSLGFHVDALSTFCGHLGGR